jgi:HEAT repeat protein
VKDLLRKLRSEDKIQIQKGLEGLAERFKGLEGSEFEEAVHAVEGLFYVDPMDHPELLPVLEQAEGILAELREKVIPVLLQSLGESDLKTHFHLAAVLGKMGYAAVNPLLEAYQQATDPYARVFALYALGKVKDPKVLEALPVLFEALEDPDPELRDTAARAIGKMCEYLNPDLVAEQTRSEMFERLLAKVSDRFAGVRSKAIRSLGKMARFGLLQDGQKNRLRAILTRALGEDEAGNWDVAYIVRAEAEKAKEQV